MEVKKGLLSQASLFILFSQYFAQTKTENRGIMHPLYLSSGKHCPKTRMLNERGVPASKERQPYPLPFRMRGCGNKLLGYNCQESLERY